MKKVLSSLLLVLSVTACNSNSFIQTADFNQTGYSNALSTLKGVSAFNGQMLIDGTTNDVINPGSPADLSFQFKDQSGQPVSQFELNHEKYMHLIVLNSDLSSFAHIHPDLSANGTFHIEVNKENTDPDNLDAKNAIAKPGKFLLFSEVKPKGQDAQTSRFSITANGQVNPVQIVPDQQVKPGTIIKYFTDKGEVGKPGDKYQVKLQIVKMSGMLNLDFYIQQNVGSNKYKDVTDLQPWLGMTGHAIVISKAGNTPEEKTFLHLHAGMDMPRPTMNGMDMGTGPKLEFMMMGEQIPTAGVYKVWGQFKHHGQVFALPYVFQL